MDACCSHESISDDITANTPENNGSDVNWSKKANYLRVEKYIILVISETAVWWLRAHIYLNSEPDYLNSHKSEYASD